MSQFNEQSRDKELDPSDSPLAGAPQIKESKIMTDDGSVGSVGQPQATSTPIFAGGLKGSGTPINALFQKHTPKDDASFSDLSVRKPKVRFADMEGGVLATHGDGDEDMPPPKRYRTTPAAPAVHEISMMPSRANVHSPIRTPTFPTSGKFMATGERVDFNASEASMSQVPVDLSPWTVGFRDASTNIMELNTQGRSVLRGDVDSTQADAVYLAKLKDYRCKAIELIKKRKEQRTVALQMEKAVRDKMALLGKSMGEMDEAFSATLQLLRESAPLH